MSARQSAATRSVAADSAAVVELDLFLADLAADGLLVGDGLLAQLDPLHRNGLGLVHGPLGGEGDLVLLFGDRGPVVGVAAVGLGDRPRSTVTSSCETGTVVC